MQAAEFREVLCADVAVALGALDPATAAAALASRLQSGTGSVLDTVPVERRAHVQGEVDRIVAEAGGDPRTAVARRGLHEEIPATLPPEATHALAEAGAWVHTRLRTLPPSRYVGFLPVGEGGMGIVYLALDTELNRRVAFKMIRTDSTDPLGKAPSAPDEELVARFLQEAWVTGGLEHPGIVPVYELGQTPAGVPYYTMRLVRGERTLDDAIAEAASAEQRLALLEPFLKVCDAVRYAHSRGIVHRDLKPANVALGEFGEVVVLDWGLAKVQDRTDLSGGQWQGRIEELRRATDLKTLTSALGTPGYMAPEAVAGQVKQVDARSDVYSLGAILFRILTGRLPVEVSTFAQYVEAVARGVTGVPGAPSGLEPICLRALAVKRENRYADVDELASAVRKWQAESAVEREVRSLMREAEAALETGGELQGAALLTQLDRVLAVSARILDLRPDHEGARGIRHRALAAREDAIRERERLARRQQLRYVGIAVLMLTAVLTVVVALLLDARRREAEDARAEAEDARAEAAAALGRERQSRSLTQAALERETAAREEAAMERDAKGRALDEVLRLADSKKVADLMAEEDRLWPVHPKEAPVMAAWLQRAREILGNRAGHEEALAAVRARAAPYTDEQRKQDHAPAIRRLAAVRAALERAPAGERAALEEEARRLEAQIAKRGSWRFEHEGDDWRHQVLSDLLVAFDALAAAAETVGARYKMASTLREISIDGRREEWQRSIEAIAASPRYGGLRVRPQVGLVPLGMDPDSGLFEFAQVGSGLVPARDPATGRLSLGDDFAIVLVLIPGGSFRMGAQKVDPNAPNLDPDAEDNEGPVHEVRLSPYFIAKHECTQAQWEHLTGERPSRYQPGAEFGGKKVTARNPVEQVSWDDCARWFPRHNLVLPTEAQWEYACRAGTDTPWWCGRETTSLGRVANIADAFCKSHGGPPSWGYTEDVDDGFGLHAPVGSLLPNGFGLHDVHGNVWEWCRDARGAYTAEVAVDPAREEAAYRAYRGGSYYDIAANARAAVRYSDNPTARFSNLGVRPARPVSDE